MDIVSFIPAAAYINVFNRLFPHPSLGCTAQFLHFFLAGNVFLPSDYLNFSPLYFPQLVNIFFELKIDPTNLVEASLTLNKVEGLLQVPHNAA